MMNKAIFEYKIVTIPQKNRDVQKVVYKFLRYFESYNNSLEYIRLFQKYSNMYKDRLIYISDYDISLIEPGFIARAKTHMVRLNPLIEDWQFGESLKMADFKNF